MVGGAKGAAFRGTVVISVAATALLLVAIAGARHPAQMQARGAPPWPVPSSAATGVRIAGLPLDVGPRVVTRYAVHLDVFVDGRAVPVTTGIGVGRRDRVSAPLYTDDTSGIVHVSSGAAAPVFTLGQFFDEWQVALSANRLGGLRGKPVAVYLNGVRHDGDPGTVVLAPHLQIAVEYGGRASVPASYAFPAGT